MQAQAQMTDASDACGSSEDGANARIFLFVFFGLPLR